ncbi:MAG: hypothetical protein KBT84_14820, partial [Pseudomonas sp.]|nr:hypothetical protein [Pseudomonas sp.]
MKQKYLSGLVLALAAAMPASALSAQPLRVEQLQRCGDRLQAEVQEFCLRVTGLGDSGWQARLNGTPLKQLAMEHQDGQV